MVADHPILLMIQAHIQKNFPEYAIFVSALAVATVVTMPVKAPLLREDHPLQEVWQWMRNALQTAVPAARTHQQQLMLPAPPNPTPPEDPAKPTQ